MNKTLTLLTGVLFAAALLVTACSKDTASESQAAGSDSDKPQVASTAKTDTGDHAGHDHGEGNGHDTAPKASGPATEAYAALTLEVKLIEQSVTSQDKIPAAVGKIAAKYKGFVDAYPNTPEANDARYSLGVLYASVQQPKAAIPFLSEYLDSEGVGIVTDKTGFAHYYLAEAYRGTDQYDEARTHYEIVVKEYSSINQVFATRFGPASQQMLADLDTLKKLKVGGAPIPFNVKGLNGETLSLDKYKGKVVLLDFWATWCGPCKVEMPNVIKTYQKYKDKGFEIIGVSLDRDRNLVKGFIKSSNMDWPQHFEDGAGWNNSIATKYRVRSIPATYLIDRDGKIRYRSLRGKALDDAVEELIKEKA